MPPTIAAVVSASPPQRMIVVTAARKSFGCEIEANLTPAEFIDVLRRSTLAERRPVEDVVRIARMLAGADLVVTSRDEGGTLVGVSRAITDLACCTYLPDLAVDAAHQGQGIGRELIRVTHEHVGLATRFDSVGGSRSGQLLSACRHGAA